MTPEQQRIAIAEACGTLSSFYCGHCRETRDERQRRQVAGVWFCNFCAKTPLHHDSLSYAFDLNAMHEAEKTLNREQQDSYANHLFMLLPCDENHGPISMNDPLGDVMTPSQFQVSHATAAQRAEAFLRTIGKWKS